ncbi:hypothetical protein HPB47_028015 [Ixodes persulcatus]|uniref:Uncharacterized protein n=1 Tax=Ixodes persulcatus TaxID=34615 RepID=A0AC60PUK0_IXOPE|nr:hypothetical protein HPB47_028015 [Ixodes persulcatus]
MMSSGSRKVPHSHAPSVLIKKADLLISCRYGLLARRLLGPYHRLQLVFRQLMFCGDASQKLSEPRMGSSDQLQEAVRAQRHPSPLHHLEAPVVSLVLTTNGVVERILVRQGEVVESPGYSAFGGNSADTKESISMGQCNVTQREAQMISEKLEAEAENKQLETYEDLMQWWIHHLEKAKRPTRHNGRKRKRWWDVEDSMEWREYQDSKVEVTTLIQTKMAKADKRFLEDLKEVGREAPRKFWRHVRDQTGKPREDPMLKDDTTGRQLGPRETIRYIEERVRSMLAGSSTDAVDENEWEEGVVEREAKSRRNKGIATARALWGYNRYEVTRAVWKMVVVPGLTFGNSALCLPSGTRQYLEVRQREPRSSLELQQSIRTRVIESETRRWAEAARRKPALALYAREKQEVKRIPFMDNSKGSALLSVARGGMLRTRVLRAKPKGTATLASRRPVA